jgi:hypothetical protein
MAAFLADIAFVVRSYMARSPHSLHLPPIRRCHWISANLCQTTVDTTRRIPARARGCAGFLVTWDPLVQDFGRESSTRGVFRDQESSTGVGGAQAPSAPGTSRPRVPECQRWSNRGLQKGSTPFCKTHRARCNLQKGVLPFCTISYRQSVNHG